jgi:hypothetical protein
VASVDKAREMGIDWWEHDPTLSSGRGDLAEENRLLRERVDELEAGRATELDGGSAAAARSVEAPPDDSAEPPRRARKPERRAERTTERRRPRDG